MNDNEMNGVEVNTPEEELNIVEEQAPQPIPAITPGTIVRTVWLFVAAINYVLALFNISPIQFDNNFVTEAVDLGFLLIPAIWSWWKNNSFTKGARINDSMLSTMKDFIKGNPNELAVDITSKVDFKGTEIVESDIENIKLNNNE